MDKTDTVKRNLVNRIERGLTKSGDRIPIESELMHEFRVSRVTVRRALKELIDEKILARKPSRKGLFISGSTGGRTGLKHRNIGVLIHGDWEKGHPFMSRFLMAASTACQENDWKPQVFSLPQNLAKEKEFDFLGESLTRRDLDGILINCRLSDPTLLALEKSRIKTVLISNYLPGSTLPFLITNYGALEMLVLHLHGLGRRRIAYISGPQDERIVHENICNFQSACKSLSIPYDTSMVWEGSYDETKTETGVNHFLEMPERPDAIIAEDDLIAGHVLQVLQSLGLKCPEDIAVCGTGGVEMGRFLSPPLTTVRIPIEEAARQGTVLLQKIISGDPVEKVQFALAGELVIRRSCGAGLKK